MLYKVIIPMNVLRVILFTMLVSHSETVQLVVHYERRVQMVFVGIFSHVLAVVVTREWL